MRKLLTFLFWVIAILAIVGVVLRFTILDVWRVPDDRVLDSSLRPTIAAGDLVVLYRGSAPGFGSLVRCPDPEDAQRFVVGRIIGVEGDKITFDKHRVIVNGKRYEETQGCGIDDFQVPEPTNGSHVQANCERVEMGGGWHLRAWVPDASVRDSEHTVGAGRVFIVSDNRSYHDDSRDFGSLPLESCSETILFRLWSQEGLLDGENRFSVIR